MKASKSVISILFLSAACATPAFANYFNNTLLGLHANIGSAPNPTPRDLREGTMPQLTHRNQSSTNFASKPTTVRDQRADNQLSSSVASALAPVPDQHADSEQSPAQSFSAADTIPALRLTYL